MSDATVSIRSIALSDYDIELVISALVYLKNMSLAFAAESGLSADVDEEIIDQLDVLIKQFEEQ